MTFNDYQQPNTALKEKQVTANYFQHVPFMEEFEKKAGTKLAFVAPVHLEPLGVYSKKVKDLRAVPQGATVAVPNDPANEGRSLKLLADNGLLTLAGRARERDRAGHREQPQGPEVQAPEGRAAAPLAGGRRPVGDQRQLRHRGRLAPNKDALVAEKAEGNPYANGIVTLPENKDDPRVKKLVQLLQGPEVRKYVEDKYKGSVLIAS